MIDAEILSELLEAVADPDVARKRSREVQTLRGVRGVPYGEVTHIGAAAWAEQGPDWDDEAELSTLFATAYEDGLLAIGLLAALLPDAPREALDVARDWLARIDDNGSADALGWLVLGPALLATGQAGAQALSAQLASEHTAVRRAAVMAAMAWLPEEIEGPAAAPLRARLGVGAVRFVDEPASEPVQQVVLAALRDPDPSVRKALRRVWAAWAAHAPEEAEQLTATVPGGVPKMLREAVVKAARRGRRLGR